MIVVVDVPTCECGSLMTLQDVSGEGEHDKLTYACEEEHE